jgi:hypothetical protein
MRFHCHGDRGLIGPVAEGWQGVDSVAKSLIAKTIFVGVALPRPCFLLLELLS